VVLLAVRRVLLLLPLLARRRRRRVPGTKIENDGVDGREYKFIFLPPAVYLSPQTDGLEKMK